MRLRLILRPTPAIEPPDLASLLGCRVVLKCENLNPTGAFKVRGGVNLVAALTREERLHAESSQPRQETMVSRWPTAHGSLTASAVIFMPENANPLKVVRN